jgi:hypothetical protein
LAIGFKEVGEMRELGAYQILDLDPFPSAPDEEILIGCKRPNALGEAPDVILGTSSDGLVSDSIHDAEHVPGAMVDLAHEEVLLLLTQLAFRNVVSGTNHADSASLAPNALETNKPVSLHPADFAVRPPVPELGRVRLWIGGIKRRFYGRPNPF